MIAVSTSLAQIRTHYTPDTMYLFRILLNASSVVEANISLDLLRKSIPDRPLVTAINLREVLKSLPPSPFQMAVDEETLIRVAGLEKRIAVLAKTTSDGYDIVVTTAGNLVLDLIVKLRDEKFFWTPMPRKGDFVCPELIDHIVQSDHLLGGVIDLVQAMGLVFNPRLHLSIDDWHLEYAQEAIEGIGDLF